MSPKKMSKILTSLSNTGAFLREHGFYEEGLACFFALSEEDDTFGSGDYAFEIGICYLEMKKPERAELYFEIAIRENPAVYTHKVAEINEKRGISS